VERNRDSPLRRGGTTRVVFYENKNIFPPRFSGLAATTSCGHDDATGLSRLCRPKDFGSPSSPTRTTRSPGPNVPIRRTTTSCTNVSRRNKKQHHTVVTRTWLRPKHFSTPRYGHVLEIGRFSIILFFLVFFPAIRGRSLGSSTRSHTRRSRARQPTASYYHTQSRSTAARLLLPSIKQPSPSTTQVSAPSSQ